MKPAHITFSANTRIGFKNTVQHVLQWYCAYWCTARAACTVRTGALCVLRVLCVLRDLEYLVQQNIWYCRISGTAFVLILCTVFALALRKLVLDGTHSTIYPAYRSTKYSVIWSWHIFLLIASLCNRCFRFYTTENCVLVLHTCYTALLHISIRIVFQGVQHWID